MNTKIKMLLCVVFVAGCGMMIPRAEYISRHIAPKAAFDFQCPENQLQFQNSGPPTDGWIQLPAGGSNVKVLELSI
jgi:hypothetical protein